MPARGTDEYQPYVQAWKRRFESIRQTKARLARQAREEAKAIGRLLGDRFGVETVYLIGSALDDERFDEGSDLDIAVEGLEARRYWSAVAAIEEMTRFPFDLIDLETAGKSMVERVRNEGLVLYDRRREKAPEP